MNESFYKNHPKPKNSVPSPYLVINALKYIEKGSTILEVGCGYGRNSIYLAEQDHKVFAIDAYEKVFTTNWADNYSNIQTIVQDATKELLFSHEMFDVIVIIHFYDTNLFQRISKLVKHSGVIIYESIGGHGENWKQLDKYGKIKKDLQSEFIFLDYKERSIGPLGQYSTLKMVAKRL